MSGVWPEVPLGEFADVVGGGTPSTKEPSYWGGDVAWITPKDLSRLEGRFVGRGDRSITVEGLEASSAKVLPPGTLVVSSRAPIGYVAIAAKPLATNQGCRSLVFKDDEPKFFYYVLKSSTKKLEALANGTTFREISGTGMKRVAVPRPPLDQQKAIASILGALDNKIEQRRQTALEVERLLQTLFQAWFVDFEPVKAKAAGAAFFPSMPQHVFESLPSRLVDSGIRPMPEGWHSGSLGDAIDIHDFRRVPLSRRERQRRKGPFRYYGATGIVDYVDDFLFDGRFVLVGEDGTVISDNDGPVVQYVWGQFWVNNHAHVLTGAGGISTEYLRLLLDSINIRPFVTGAVQLKLNQRNLRSVPVIAPPPQAVSAFEEIIAPQFALLRQAHDESRLLESVRDLLLPPLVDGRVRVADVDG
ncbi:MAG: restriction endonuclease subunit S [Dehalococcoidia bacterium]|nr:restriction endonuclease subunit S [Dehalococcoidia bacterium]MXZ54086.1 restriction endonuclease subunit S [Acidimicrobiaceae bacterium]MYB87227.1 restriction endonuclease subunit S [Acidimicrobiaceae bacterium]MYH93360.1 restriction endonuclease subunit S [Acidimicrobiaceae bacterium]